MERDLVLMRGQVERAAGVEPQREVPRLVARHGGVALVEDELCAAQRGLELGAGAEDGEVREGEGEGFGLVLDVELGLGDVGGEGDDLGKGLVLGSRKPAVSTIEVDILKR